MERTDERLSEWRGSNTDDTKPGETDETDETEGSSTLLRCVADVRTTRGRLFPQRRPRYSEVTMGL